MKDDSEHFYSTSKDNQSGSLAEGFSFTFSKIDTIHPQFQLSLI